MLSRCVLDLSVGVWGFCHTIESDLFLFLLFRHHILVFSIVYLVRLRITDDGPIPVIRT